jgi:hypothetical protein
MAKISRPTVYVLIAAVAGAAYFMTSGGVPTSKSSIKAAPRRTEADAKSAFTDADLHARFERLNERPKNAFMPLVARRSLALGLIAPNSVPSELAGGDPNWVYTGTAIVDEAPTALLENPVTMEMEFVKQGQQWIKAEVKRILPSSIVLANSNGREYVVRLADPGAVSGDAGVVNGAGFRPLNPGLSGPIGGGIAVQPEGANRSASRTENTETRNAN